ncbi:MAG: hypothetical protein IJ714_01620 [Bacteroidales bacterium]|nr:hypothetical protein [Bacteroidales bacterium]MBR1698469.1 hypothetical protein [Bacteroidales bacterium]
MKTINFKQFKMFTDIRQENTILVDYSVDVADLIYKNSNGIMPHDIAMRIYKSDGPVSFSDEEFAFLQEFVKGMTPIFQDSFVANVVDETN